MKVLEKEWEYQTDFKNEFTFEEACKMFEALMDDKRVSDDVVNKFDSFVHQTYGWLMMDDYEFNEDGEPLENEEEE